MLSKYKHGNNIMNMENIKTIGRHKFVLILSKKKKKLDLKNSNGYAALRSYLIHVEKYKATVQKQ